MSVFIQDHSGGQFSWGVLLSQIQSVFSFKLIYVFGVFFIVSLGRRKLPSLTFSILLVSPSRELAPVFVFYRLAVAIPG